MWRMRKRGVSGLSEESPSIPARPCAAAGRISEGPADFLEGRDDLGVEGGV